QAPLLKLLGHESWRVRAEAVDALIELKEGAQQDKAVLDALRKLLDDPDGYVAGRAMIALEQSRDAGQLTAMFEAADRHHELLPEIIGSLRKDENMRNAAIPTLRKLASHPSAAVRRAVLNLLAAAEDIDISSEIIAGLSDPDDSVKIAAADALPVAA